MPLQIINSLKTPLAKKIHLLYDEVISDNAALLQNKKITIKICTHFERNIYKHSGKQLPFSIFKLYNSGVMGLVVLPQEADFAEFVLYFRPQVFEDNQYFNTVTHELTHVTDYAQYFSQYFGNGKKNNNEYFSVFHFFTEYNATKRGLIKYKQEYNKKGRLNLGRYAAGLLAEIKGRTFPASKIYFLAKYYAVLSILDTSGSLIFKKYTFNPADIIAEFGEPVLPLYHLLYKAANYKEFDKNKKEIYGLFQQLKQA